MLTYSSERARQLEENLAKVKEQISLAAQDLSGARTADSPLPELVVVTKFFPAEDLAALYAAGVRRVGENRDQEAAPKAAALLEETGASDPLRWSFIGQLQTNKAKSVVRYASQVQSVDRPSLVGALSQAYSRQLERYEQGQGSAPAALADGGLNCLIQVSLEDSLPATAGQAASGARGGAAPTEVLAIAEQIAEAPGLTLGGVMAVAPLGADPQRAFESLYGISQQLQESYPQASAISAGMSSDLTEAIRWGSTMVRVGSQIMGPRPVQ